MRLPETRWCGARGATAKVVPVARERSADTCAAWHPERQAPLAPLADFGQRYLAQGVSTRTGCLGQALAGLRVTSAHPD